MKLVFVSTELAPLVNVGKLGHTISELIHSLKEHHEITFFLPLYKKITDNNSKTDLLETEKYKGELLSVSGHPVRFWKTTTSGINIILVQNDYFFTSRNNIYGYEDDCVRFALYCKAITEIIPRLDFRPDVVHAHDWHTALIPLLLKSKEESPKTVLTIHDISYQGLCNPDILSFLGLDRSFFATDKLEYYSKVNFLKAGILYSDAITTNSLAYLNEIQTNYAFTYGLSELMSMEKYKCTGIPTGIEDSFNPGTDKNIDSLYSTRDISGKLVCKTHLQKELNLPIHTEIPIIVIPSTNIENDETFLLNSIVPYLVRMELQIVILGYKLGDFERNIREAAFRLNCTATSVEYNKDNIRKVFSGADIFLDTSKTYANDNLAKIALKYGVLPIVFNESPDMDIEQNRFRIFNFTPDDLINTIKYAINRYYYMEMWNEKVKKVMSYDFSWHKTISEYNELYGNLAKNNDKL